MIPQFLKSIPNEPDYLITEYGKVWSKNVNRFMKAHYNNGDYEYVKLYKNRHRYVHRLVAEAWLPNPDNLPVVHHKDGCQSNNHYSNLEWCTQQYNIDNRR